MKNIFNIITITAAFLCCWSCQDVNDQFDGLDDMTSIENVQSSEYTLTAADYTSISENSENIALAKENGDTTRLESLASTMTFTSSLSAATYIPAFLAETYITLDESSSINVTYNYTEDAPDYLSDLTGAEIYTATNDDYETAWGESGSNYFTPAHTAEDYANTILSSAFENATSGDVTIFKYNYYEGSSDVSTLTSLDEDFETVTAYENVSVSGWTNYAETGDVYWEGRSYSSNLYAQCSAYGASGDVVSWLVSPQLDLSGLEDPKLTFDVVLGYYNADCLQVMVSEDFNGADPTSATWTDITSNFAFYHASSGYTSFYCPGIADLSSYQENPVYIAFKYVGNSDDATTTFEVDNVQVNSDSELSYSESVTYEKDFTENNIDDWTNVIVQGSEEWEATSYGAKISAYGTSEEQEVWLTSSSITVPSSNAPQLKFTICNGYYNATCLSVKISMDFTGDVSAATWVDITDNLELPEVTSGYSDFISYAYSLNDYLGENITVAFEYVGNGSDSRTTTYEIGEVKIVSYTSTVSTSSLSLKSSNLYTTYYVAYEYDGSEWAEYDGTVMPNSTDYESMGISYLSSSDDIDSYLTTYLVNKYPYAQESDTMAVIYLYGSSDDLGAQEYIYSSGSWNNSVDPVEESVQFVLSEGAWNPDPTISHTMSADDYQIIVDYVKENVDSKYIDSYETAESYYGTSAYYEDFYSTDSYRDTDVFSTWQEAVETAIQDAYLPNKYTDAVAQVNGVDVNYVITFVVYGTTSGTFSATFQCVSSASGSTQAKFEYVEDSLTEE